MPGFSALLKMYLRRKEAKKKIDALDNAIAQAEREYSEPFIKTLSGVERFESAVVLIDSTFLKRINSISDQNGKEELVEVYLDKLSEEYQMAKGDLQRAPASRAEVVALGLAVKEIALSLDREITVFRQQSDEAIGQFQGVANKHQREAQHLTAELTQQQSRIRDENEKYRGRLQTELELAKAEQATHITNLTASVKEELHRVSVDIEQRMAEAGEEHQQLLGELSSKHEEAACHLQNVTNKHQLEMQRQAAELTDQVAHVREENEKYRSRMQTELELAKAEQATHITNLTASVKEELHRVSVDIEQRMAEAGEQHQQLLGELSSKHEEAVCHLQNVTNKHQLEMQRQAAELTDQVAHVREENEKYRSRMQTELESAKAEQATHITNLTALVKEEFHRLSGELGQRVAEAAEKHQELLAELSSREKQDTERLDKNIKRMRLWTATGFVLLILAVLVMVLK